MKLALLVSILTTAVILVLGTAVVHLGDYAHSTRCASSQTVSRYCVTRTSATVVQAGWSAGQSKCIEAACSSKASYDLRVRTGAVEREISLKEARPELTVGTEVQLLSWHGRPIAIEAGGRRTFVLSWHPVFLMWLLAISMVLTVVILFVSLYSVMAGVARRSGAEIFTIRDAMRKVLPQGFEPRPWILVGPFVLYAIIISMTITMGDLMRVF